FYRVIRALIPSLGVIELERAVVNISSLLTFSQSGNKTLDNFSAISAFQEEIHDLSRVVLQNRMALNFLVATQGGVCAVINTSCSYMDQSGRIKKDLA
ncbi:ERVV2 protein, partial [Zosterops hypoxanthus]|nr:ERVV2 protein [Zosterops hypoxanthus]